MGQEEPKEVASGSRLTLWSSGDDLDHGIGQACDIQGPALAAS